MDSATRLEELLLVWRQQKESGQPVSLDTLCGEDGQLREELRRRINAIQQMETILHLDENSDTGQETPAGWDRYRQQLAVQGYELLEELGQGGIAVVYKARQVELERIVAIKILSHRRVSESQLARFRIEVEAIARLDHPHIVHIYDVGELEGRPFYAMEYVAGGTLGDQLGRERVPHREAAELVESLARTMQFVHDRGIVHRDIKPANVLLAEDGTPKITDFGLAKRLNDDSGHTQTGEIVGTPFYMAPEQAEGQIRDVGPETDIYALGVVLYEALSGGPPFTGSSPLDVMRQITSKDPTPLRQLDSMIARDLEAICLKCLEKSPSARYSSSAELVQDLRSFLEHRPVAARQIDPLRRTLKWVRRKPEQAALAGVCLLLLVACSAVLGYYLGSQRDEHRMAIEVAPQAREILHRNCYACHGADPNLDDKEFNVLDYEYLIHSDRDIIVPYQPEDSRLLQRIADGSMPPEEEELNLPRLAQSELRILRQWIAGGAPPLPDENTQSTPPVIPINERALQAKQVFIKHCYECHKFDRAEGGIKIMHHRLLVHIRKTVHPADPQRSELFRLITSNDPDRQMPPSDIEERMTAAEIEIIRQWILEGAAPFPKS